jgi:hypothetical protein
LQIAVIGSEIAPSKVPFCLKQLEILSNIRKKTSLKNLFNKNTTNTAFKFIVRPGLIYLLENVKAVLETRNILIKN